MIETIAAAIVGGAATFAGIYAYGRVEYWKGMYNTSADDVDAALNKVAEAEKTSQLIADKYTTLTQLVQMQAERPVVCALSDKHVDQIASTLSNLVMMQQNPNRIN